MKAILCQEFGSPDLLKVVDQPIPIAGPGQVVVQHRAWTSPIWVEP